MYVPMQTTLFFPQLSLEVDTTQPDSPSPPTSPATHSSSIATTADEGSSSIEEYPIGSMVWGRLQGYDWWPGMVISYCKDREGDTEGGEGEGGGMQVWIKWYGENNLSQVSYHIVTSKLCSRCSKYITPSPHSLIPSILTRFILIGLQCSATLLNTSIPTP